MPSKRTISGSDLANQEGRILLAIQAYKNNEITNIREAARRFGVPRTTLRNSVMIYQPVMRLSQYWCLRLVGSGVAGRTAAFRR
jgi:hypothetical protein